MNGKSLTTDLSPGSFLLADNTKDLMEKIDMYERNEQNNMSEIRPEITATTKDNEPEQISIDLTVNTGC